MEKPLLLLIDGHALVHRAFHALPSLTVSKTGEPTGAVYGFIRMLLKVLQDFQPTHWAIAFDRPAPTFRHLEFEEYKAQRPPAPDELKLQFKRVRQLVEALNMPIYEMDGYEADDILGTLSRQASEGGIDALIVTGDTDMMQLVAPKVRVLLPQRTFGDITLYDEAAVQQKYGLAPNQIPDFKGLKGDPSDNIPGVHGIGEKTAAKLIQHFGNVESIYQRIDEVAPDKLKDTLLAQEEQARQSKRLATIRLDVPVVFDIVHCQAGGYDRSKLVELFRNLEFFTLLDKLPVVGEYLVVDTLSALEELVAQLSNTTSFVLQLAIGRRAPGAVELAGIALSPTPGKAYYLPLGHRAWEQQRQLPLQQAVDQLQPLLMKAHIGKTVHDGKEIMTTLMDYGVEPGNLDFDTMIAAYLLGEKSLGLKALAFSKLGLEMLALAEAIDAKRASVAEASISLVTKHICSEADVIGRLRPLLQANLEEKGLWRLFAEVEMPLVPVLARMERNGVALDTDLLRHMSQSLGEQQLKLEQEIYSNVGHRFNINSPQQLGAVLFGELKLPGAKRTKSGYSTDASVLESLRELHPVVKLILEYRQLMKLRSTYIDALPALINPRTGRVHTSFNQAATATGRLSSSDPNLQNIPIRGEYGKQIRCAFLAQPPCLLVGADYSQIELRVMAHLCQDPNLLAAFREDKDIHTTTASEVFGVAPKEVTPDMRRVAKVVNFGIIYGISEYGLEQATELSREEAGQLINSYFQRYPKLKDYIESTKQQVKDKGYVQTLLGRRRYIPEINSSNRQVREAAERMAINMPVQGTAADIIKIAMINLQREIDKRGLRSKLILQVHDELLLETPPEELGEVRGLVEETMSQAVELSVPLKVEIKVGRNWGEME